MPYKRMLTEFRRLMDEVCFVEPEFIWSDPGLTESLYSPLIYDVSVVKMLIPDPVDQPAGGTCPWQRNMQLTLIQLRLGTDRTGTGRIYQYRRAIPHFEIGRAEHAFGTTCNMFGYLAQLPLVRAGAKHTHDLLLTMWCRPPMSDPNLKRAK